MSKEKGRERKEEVEGKSWGMGRVRERDGGEERIERERENIYLKASSSARLY